MTDLPAIERPNGRLYRPRKIIGHPVTDSAGFVTGIAVLGTHDVGRAQMLADLCVSDWVDDGFMAASPETGWYRDGFYFGERHWMLDDAHGRAGVMFQEIVERSG